jgi:twitching motility protein PilU
MDLSLNLMGIISQRLVPKAGGGRCAAIEILLNSPFVSDLIFKGEVHALKEAMAKSAEMGMQTFDQALYTLFEAGQITYEDALRNADSMSELKLNIKLNSKRAQKDDARPKVELSIHHNIPAEAETEGGPATFASSSDAPKRTAGTG